MKSDQVLAKLRQSRILSIQDYGKVNPLDIGGWPEVNAPMGDYDREYPGRLKEYLGIDLLIAHSEELNQEIARVKGKEAQEIADVWMDEAEEVRGGVQRGDVIRAAKLYVALRELRERYDADGITMASWHLAGYSNTNPVTNVMPPLSWMEFSKENIPCCCEGLINCLVTQMVGTYVTDGYAGFVGDVLNGWVDWDSFLKGPAPGDVVIIGHCGAPITPHGDDRISYTITNHVIDEEKFAESFELFKPEETATATTVDWPSDEVASVVKFDVYGKKIFICTGTTIDGNSLYKNFADTACRNKMVIRIDDPEAYQMFSGNRFGEEWGIHPVVFYGDLREEIRDFAALTTFDLVEK